MSIDSVLAVFDLECGTTRSGRQRSIREVVESKAVPRTDQHCHQGALA